jgi:hypothetical protein
MFCEYCGQEMKRSRARCPKCHHRSSAFWLNVIVGLFLLLTGAGLYFYYADFFPVIANLALGLGLNLPLPVRMVYSVGAHFAQTWFLVASLVVLIALAVLTRMRDWPLVRVGKGIALVTLFLLVTLLVGAAGGELWMLDWFPTISFNARVAGNELRERDALDAIYVLQHEVAAEDPARGYACSVADLDARIRKLTANSEALADARDNFYNRLTFGPGFTGYQFSITGCSGPKASSYKVLAIPYEVGRTAFSAYCADASGAVTRKALRRGDDPKIAGTFTAACR